MGSAAKPSCIASRAANSCVLSRRFVTEKYAAVLDAFYSGESEVELSTEITFENGRKSVLQSRLAIGDVDEPLPPAAAAARRLEEAVAVAG